jgi:hypothetical protein
MRFPLRFASTATLLPLAVPIARRSGVPGYMRSNLVSDISRMAQVTDPKLKYP